MNIAQQYVIVLLTTSSTVFLLACFVYFKNSHKTVNQTFTFYSLCIVIWSLGQAYHNSATNRIDAIFWARFFHVGVFFISTGFLHFTLVLLDINQLKRRLIAVIYSISFIFLFFDFTPLFISNAVPKFSINYYWVMGPIYPFFLMFFSCNVIYALFLMHKYYKFSTGIKQNQLKLLFWSSLFGYIGGYSNFLPLFNIHIYPFNPWGTFTVPIYAGIVVYAIVKYRLMDIQVVFSKTLVMILLGTGVVGFHLLSVKLLHPVIGYYPASIVSLLIIGGVLFATPLSRKLQLGVDQMVLKGKYDYQNMIKEASRTVTTILDMNELVNYIINLLRQSFGVDKVALLMKTKDGAYRLEYGYGIGEQLHEGYAIRNGMIELAKNK
ncbi:MAG: histidine kinase N-terminal 7TM domain-containing protein [bacterium]